MTKETRDQVFKLKSKAIPGLEDMPDDMVWGLVMEASYDEGQVSVVSLINGTTSLFDSINGDILGTGDEHEVAALAAAIVNGGNLFFAGYAEPVKSTPYPPKGDVHFYFISNKEILKTDPVDEETLEDNSHPFSPLYHTMQLLMSVARENKDAAA